MVQATTKVLDKVQVAAGAETGEPTYPFTGKLAFKPNLHKAVCYLKYGERYRMRDLAAFFKMSLRDLYRILEEHEIEGQCKVCREATDVPDW